ncbi:MAG: hypothetical protein Q7S75_03730 [bacterium]|nr:hypothetical protein [bacterium]
MGIKAPLVTIIALVFFGSAIAYFWNVGNVRELPNDSDVACTMEAKLCPDGSYVGRTGPNCEFTQCPPTDVSTNPATGTLAVGANATINGTTIGVLGLAEDSRCPRDVQCIQAGTVRVRVSIDSYNKDFTFTLNEPQVVGDATVTLVSVIPAQKYSTQTVQLSDYRFIFTVSKVIPTSDGNIPPYNSGIRGTVMLGPTCPVMRDPPDPQCADRGYETQVSVFRTGNNLNPIATTKSNARGIFEVSLPPGGYIILAEGGKTLPRCSPVTVSVTPNNYISAVIQCDTGIR